MSNAQLRGKKSSPTDELFQMLTSRTDGKALSGEGSTKNQSIFQASSSRVGVASMLMARNNSLDSVRPREDSAAPKTRRLAPSMGSEDFKSMKKLLEEPSTLAPSPAKVPTHARTQDGSNPDRLKEFSIKTNAFSRILLNERIELPKRFLKRKDKAPLFNVPSLHALHLSQKQRELASESSSGV